MTIEKTPQVFVQQPHKLASAKETLPSMWGDDGPGVDDFIDFINPLQHIPVVSTLYRAITGDEISHAAKMVGGGIFGGPLGIASAAASSIFEEATGEDIGETVLSSLTDQTTNTTEKSGAYHLMDTRQKLTPDDSGLSLLNVAYAQLIEEQQTAATETIPESSEIKTNFSDYERTDLGLKDSNMRRQLTSEMDKQVADLIS